MYSESATSLHFLANTSFYFLSCAIRDVTYWRALSYSVLKEDCNLSLASKIDFCLHVLNVSSILDLLGSGS